MDLNSRIRSPFNGRVLEIRTGEGTLLEAGQVVLTLELTEHGRTPLRGVLFFSLADGKRIEPGMPVRVIPDTVKREEFGHILGQVSQTYDYAMSYDGMLRLVGSATLAKVFSESGTSIAVLADLTEDASTPSGLRWSSSQGIPSAVAPGTSCTAEVVIRYQPPISLVIPYLKRFFGV